MFMETCAQNPSPTGKNKPPGLSQAPSASLWAFQEVIREPAHYFLSQKAFDAGSGRAGGVLHALFRSLSQMHSASVP